MAISKRAGFACAAGACVALTGTAFAGVQGDGPFNPFEITALPFTDTQDTTGFTDGFDLICPFSGSTSSDVWYSYTTPAEGIALSVDVCESAYDTKLYILDDALNEIVCVDDSCSSSGGALFRSNIAAELGGGLSLFIVVDGYAGENGVYNLIVEETTGPNVECPDGAGDEGEECGLDTNGGCNATPDALFSDVSCGDTVCGTAWADAGTRDTDWYRLGAQGETTLITYDVVGEFDGAYFYLGENPDCGNVAVVTAVTPLAEEAAQIAEVATGETWWFAGVNGFEGVPCDSSIPFGNDYVISFSCTTDIPPTPCPDLGDLNTDGFVDFGDLLSLLANWGECP